MARVIENLVVRLDNVWTQYPDSVLKGLQDMYAKGHDRIEIVVRSDPEIAHLRFLTKFQIDFTTLTQTNVHTKKTHKLRIVPAGGAYAKMKGALAKIYPVDSMEIPSEGNSSKSDESPLDCKALDADVLEAPTPSKGKGKGKGRGKGTRA